MKNNVKVQDDTQSLQSCVSVSVSELRIGNLLKFGNNICKVYEINNLNFYIRNEKEDESLKSSWANIEPIPLTEEWLLKLGFEKSNRIDLGELKPCYVMFSLALMIRHNSFFIDWIGGNTELKYVHQLQNLYHALTGLELQIGNLTEH